MAIITTADLAKWTQNDLDEVDADPFAVDLIDKVSQLVCLIGGHQEWMTEAAPIDVWMVTLGVCKRSYENPGRVIQDTTGPLGERVADAQALFTELTDAERATIEKYNASATATSGPAIFTVSTDDSTVLGTADTIYATDNQQVNLGTTLSWDVPFLDSGDVPA